jgi:hypothetical protein
MVDPELKSNITVSPYVDVAVHISNGSAAAQPAAGSQTTVINLNVPSSTRHRDIDNAGNSPPLPNVPGFIEELVKAREQGAVTVEQIKQLAKAKGLSVQSILGNIAVREGRLAAPDPGSRTIP